MTSCDMCGKDAFLYKAEIEGITIQVCKECGRFGKILGAAKAEVKVKKQKMKQEIQAEEIIVSDFGKRIRQKREQLKMTQEDFAKMIKERLSTLQKMEAENFKPDLETAKKLEKVLKIKLTEMVETEQMKVNKGGSLPTITIGDLLTKNERI
ncbi:MAG: multiprotein bridging factor aMBF1 [Candidatus Pacearchaeota archaeon]